MSILIREMSLRDYPQVSELWERIEGIGLSESDSEPAIDAYLARNPSLSAVAERGDGEIVGAVLCGHDGRRGYLHHLAVAASYRRQGIAARLLSHCLAGLAAHGILKCNVFLFSSNEAGERFWLHNGWSLRSDLRVAQQRVQQPAPLRREQPRTSASGRGG